MPVTITLEQLAHHVRIDLSADADDPTRLILADLLDLATETINEYAGDATPTSCLNMAVTQLFKYLYDQPNAPKGPGYGIAIVNSGATGMLNRWRKAGA